MSYKLLVSNRGSKSIQILKYVLTHMVEIKDLNIDIKIVKIRVDDIDAKLKKTLEAKNITGLPALITDNDVFTGPLKIKHYFDQLMQDYEEYCAKSKTKSPLIMRESTDTPRELAQYMTKQMGTDDTDEKDGHFGDDDATTGLDESDLNTRIQKYMDKTKDRRVSTAGKRSAGGIINRTSCDKLKKDINESRENALGSNEKQNAHSPVLRQTEDNIEDEEDISASLKKMQRGNARRAPTDQDDDLMNKYWENRYSNE